MLPSGARAPPTKGTLASEPITDCTMGSSTLRLDELALLVLERLLGLLDLGLGVADALRDLLPDRPRLLHELGDPLVVEAPGDLGEVADALERVAEHREDEVDERADEPSDHRMDPRALLLAARLRDLGRGGGGPGPRRVRVLPALVGVLEAGALEPVGRVRGRLPGGALGHRGWDLELERRARVLRPERRDRRAPVDRR